MGHPGFRSISLAGAILLGLVACVTGSRGDRTLRDCADCPLLVVVPAGEFRMGSPVDETSQPGWPPKAGGNERPVHEVRLAKPFAIGQYEVTVRQFAAFITDSNYEPPPGCLDLTLGIARGGPAENPALSWRNPGFAQQPDEPVVCVSWNDAVAYTEWLTKRTGLDYRLPTEAEWEYAARAGTSTAYFWGDDPGLPCLYANTRTAPEVLAREQIVTEGNFPCDDTATTLSPVGRYQPNAFGLYDALGNAFEWTADCNHPDYDDAPTDGSAWLDPRPCVFRVMRGGSAMNGPRQNRAASRGGRPASGHAYNLGFRVARSLDGSWAGTAASMPAAMNEAAILPDGSPGSTLFQQRCAGCHVDRNTFRGVYGTDRVSIADTIRTGGANTMSMPAWADVLSETEIEQLTDYVRRAAGWD